LFIFGSATRPWVRPIYDGITTAQVFEDLINVCIEHPHVRSLELQVSEIQHSLHAEIETDFFAATGRELR
jgi:hypothetical protein